MKFNLINSPNAKAIVAAIGATATFVEAELAPHGTAWIIVGAILAAATAWGVWLQENAPQPNDGVMPAPDPGTGTP